VHTAASSAQSGTEVGASRWSLLSITGEDMLTVDRKSLGAIKKYGSAVSNKALLQADPTQPSARMINGVPLFVSPSAAADIVWAIPRQHPLFVIRQDASVVTDSSVYFTSDRVAIRATVSRDKTRECVVQPSNGGRHLLRLGLP
jgi:hypothetical protein